MQTTTLKLSPPSFDILRDALFKKFANEIIDEFPILEEGTYRTVTGRVVDVGTDEVEVHDRPEWSSINTYAVWERVNDFLSDVEV